MTKLLRARILVLSDSVSRGDREDRSGSAARDLLEANGWRVDTLEILPDDEAMIRSKLDEWAQAAECEAVFTSGGTGVSPRDVTPEATRAVIEKEVPGLAERMRSKGAEKTPLAVLSRGIVGFRRGVLIVNLPGSPRGVRESLEAVIGVLPHAVELVRGRTQHSE